NRLFGGAGLTLEVAEHAADTFELLLKLTLNFGAQALNDLAPGRFQSRLQAFSPTRHRRLRTLIKSSRLALEQRGRAALHLLESPLPHPFQPLDLPVNLLRGRFRLREA